MRKNYRSDMGVPEDQRLSSLRSSLISPNPAYLAQQQQWNQGDHSSSWSVTDGDFGPNNQYPNYEQQQQWIIDQYAPAREQSFVDQRGYWGGHEPHGQQMLGNSDQDAMVVDQTNSGFQSNNNKVGIDENITKENEGPEASNSRPSSKLHSANRSAREKDNSQSKTPPTDHELQMKRAAAIASLQKRTASAGASGNESTPPRGTPPQNATQVVTTAKEGKYSGAQRSLFQTGDEFNTKRKPSSADSPSPIERTAKFQSNQSIADGKIGSSALKTPSNRSIHYQKKVEVEATKDITHKASSIDIDGLLAEGRAAAEASHKSETKGDGKSMDSPKTVVHRKGGSKKDTDAETGSYRRNSLTSAVSSDPSEMGEIRDKSVHQHNTSHPKLKEKGAIPESRKNPDMNSLSRNPTTKTDNSSDNKASKQSTKQLGDSEKRRGSESRAPKDPDSPQQTSRPSSIQSSQPRVEKYPVSKSELRSVDTRSAEKVKKTQGLHSRPDRPIYEPTRHSSRYKSFDHPNQESKGKNESDRASTAGYPYPKTTDTRASNDSRKSAVEDTKSGFDNSFAHLDPLEAEELREWLAVTGYHDEAFRRKTLQRHRRLAVLERERAELLKEEQEERGVLTNARSQSLLSPDAHPVPGTPSLSFSANIPPPKSVNRNDSTPKSFTYSDDRIGASNSVTGGSPARNDSRASRGPLLKRRLSASASHDSDIKPIEKIARTSFPADAPHKQDSSQDRHREFSSSRRDRESRDGNEDDNVKVNKDKLTMDGMNEERRDALIRRRSSNSISPDGREKENDHQNRYPYESNRTWRDWSESSEYKDYGPSPVRGRGRGRFHRAWHRGSPFFRPHRPERKGDGNDLDLHLGDVKYFMVKSWTHDNVEISQREGTWATQEKNLESFSKAFEECRHVILVFSVNTSKAFQGYARMESRLGAPGVRAPSWAKELVWDPTPPFKIRWITINETRFRYIGHLKNSYNEDEPVLVGRDGQEIEPQCGQSLCEIIDNENPNTQANPTWVKPHKP